MDRNDAQNAIQMGLALGLIRHKDGDTNKKDIPKPKESKGLYSTIPPKAVRAATVNERA